MPLTFGRASSIISTWMDGSHGKTSMNSEQEDPGNLLYWDMLVICFTETCTFGKHCEVVYSTITSLKRLVNLSELYSDQRYKRTQLSTRPPNLLCPLPGEGVSWRRKPHMHSWVKHNSWCNSWHDSVRRFLTGGAESTRVYMFLWLISHRWALYKSNSIKTYLFNWWFLLHLQHNL